MHTAVHPVSDATAAPERKPNPRRCGFNITTSTGCPPGLVQQTNRKIDFVDSLVDTSTQIIETVWPLSSVSCRSEMGSNGVLPLATFIRETLKRSRTSYSTLQVALYYIILIKPHVPKRDFTMEQLDDFPASRALQCGRRMFLAALILASKYLQDRNFSARAWSRISGLDTHEINQNEIAFLVAVNWNLHITHSIFQKWRSILQSTLPHQPQSPGASSQRVSLDWRQLVSKLNPKLDNIEGFTSPPPMPKNEIAVLPLPSSIPSLPAPDTMESAIQIPRSYSVPHIIEPAPGPTQCNPNRLVPAMGLPTPRPTPPSNIYNTPAVSVANSMLLRQTTTGISLAQALSVDATYMPERRYGLTTSSSPCNLTTRRSSHANSGSTASSPESMVSDSSRMSSSSISSVSSLASASSVMSDTQPRSGARLRVGEYMKPTVIASIAEEHGSCITSSPESYEGVARKDPLWDLDEIAGATNAARTLQSLSFSRHNWPLASSVNPSLVKTGSKRMRNSSPIADALQENVRDMLRGSGCSDSVWLSTLVGPTCSASHERTVQGPLRTGLSRRSKRLCRSIDPSPGNTHFSSLHPDMGVMARPGMWQHILQN